VSSFTLSQASHLPEPQNDPDSDAEVGVSSSVATYAASITRFGGPYGAYSEPNNADACPSHDAHYLLTGPARDREVDAALREEARKGDMMRSNASRDKARQDWTASW
jgi:hypothetical protein